MESDTTSKSATAPINSGNPDLLSFIKDELAADDERQAQVSAASAGELPRESQTGATMDLSHMNIGLFPQEAIILIKDKVERLALSHSPRIELPMAMMQCDRLRYLNLRWNKLTHVPDAVFTLSKLEILDVSKNAIVSISEDIKNMNGLKFLAASRNRLTRLPLALGEMNLVKLKFDDNPIEFPPPDALKAPADREASMLESEKDKDVCQRVKKFMKAAALREKLRTNLEDDLSESNVETPRAPKRSATGGRFPVRPSISGIDQFQFPAERKTASPPENKLWNNQRSHARGISSNVQPAKKPGITPLLIGNTDATRARSDTVATTSDIRSRRRGFVRRKDKDVDSNSATPFHFPGQPPALTSLHTREPSSTSNFTFLNIGSGGDSSPAVSSPIEDHPSSIFPHKATRRGESQDMKLLTNNSTRAFNRVLSLLTSVHRPVAELVQQIQTGSPKRSLLERHLESAQVHAEELSRLVNIPSSTIESGAGIESTSLRSVVLTAVTALKSYSQVAMELRRKSQQAVRTVDPFYIRCALSSAHSISVEARNICYLLGIRTRSVAPHEITQLISALSSRSIIPNQPRTASSARSRGTATLPYSTSVRGVHGKALPVPLHPNFSRSNTNPQSAMMPLTNGSYANTSSRNHLPSRSNTLRSVTTESETDDVPDKTYTKLRACCDIAYHTLPLILTDLGTRGRDAESARYVQGAHHFFVAMNKCDTLVVTSKRLLTRLRPLQSANPSRLYPQLKEMTDLITREWTDFGSEIVSLSRAHFELGSIKQKLKPVQHAVREANRAVQQLSLHVSASSKPVSSVPISAGYLGYSSDIDTSFPPLSGTNIPRVPVTPLGAALGPAVQATVASSNKNMHAQPDNFLPPQQSGTRERNDTFTQPYGSSRR